MAAKPHSVVKMHCESNLKCCHTIILVLIVVSGGPDTQQHSAHIYFIIYMHHIRQLRYQMCTIAMIYVTQYEGD